MGKNVIFNSEFTWNMTISITNRFSFYHMWKCAVIGRIVKILHIYHRIIIISSTYLAWGGIMLLSLMIYIKNVHKSRTNINSYTHTVIVIRGQCQNSTFTDINFWVKNATKRFSKKHLLVVRTSQMEIASAARDK